MTDFLDRLEADLRVAAENRGTHRRRRPRPGSALKLVAIAAVIALLVAGGARLANRDATERSARPTPTPTATPEATLKDRPATTAVVTSGNPSSLDFFARRVNRKAALDVIAPAQGRPALADPSLGSVVLYRGDEAKDLAASVARSAGIEETRPLTAADEEKINFKVSGAELVVVFGTGMQEGPLQESKRCAPGGRVTGGDLSVCLVYRDGATFDGILVDGRLLPVAQMRVRGHWIWAAASPDGKTILAQWSGECEVPEAYLIPARGGRPRSLSGGADSVALGWTTDGRAIVFLPAAPACGSEGRPGTYLVSPDGKERTLVAPATDATPPVKPSIEPRTAGEIAG